MKRMLYIIAVTLACVTLVAALSGHGSELQAVACGLQVWVLGLCAVAWVREGR